MAGWRLQSTKRVKGRYWQAVWGRGKGATTITLGYLSELDAAMSRERIGFMARPGVLGVEGANDFTLEEQEAHMQALEGCQAPAEGTGLTRASLAEQDGTGRLVLPPTKEAMRAHALSHLTRVGLLVVLEEVSKDETTLRIARGDFEGLTLGEFYRQVWDPLRKNRIAESSYKSEKRLWPAILRGLGGVKLSELTTARWVGFLDEQETWGGRTRALAQNAYKCALVHAVHLQAVVAVHSFPRIQGARKPTRPKPQPLTIEEALAVVKNASSLMHRALFGYAIGQGVRPGEARILRWEDIDWENESVHIRGKKTRESDSTVPLMPLAQEHLLTWWTKCEKPTEGPVFLWRGKPFRDWKTSWKTACKNAGIDPKKRRLFPYLARHSFATLALASGANDAAVRGMMRHSWRSTILEHAYEHLSNEQLRDGMKPFLSGNKSR